MGLSMTKWALVFLLLIVNLASSSSSKYNTRIVYHNEGKETNFTVPVMTDITPGLESVWALAILLWEWGFQDAVNRTELEHNLVLEFYNSKRDLATATDQFIDVVNRNFTMTFGNVADEILTITGQLAGVLDVAMVSCAASSPIFSDKYAFPYFSRIIPPSSEEVVVINALLLELYQTQGAGWSEIGVIVSTDGESVYLWNALSHIVAPPLRIVSIQAVVEDQTDYTVEMEALQKSGARVIILICAVHETPLILQQAGQLGILGDQYVWIGTTRLANIDPTIQTTDIPVEENFRLLSGLLSTRPYAPEEGEIYQLIYDRWTAFLPGRPVENTVLNYYDLSWLTVLGIQKAEQSGYFDEDEHVTAQQWNDAFRSTEFVGASGYIKLKDNGDLFSPEYSIVNFQVDQFVSVGAWNDIQGMDLHYDEIIWKDGTSTPPDLDVREPFAYWSCADKESGYDPTGKEITIHTPDGSNVDEIDSEYRCDGFIDCRNLSDESGDCGTNFMILFIVFGILIGLLILGSLLLVVFVVVFGFIIRRRRIRAASPPFLLVIIASCIVGYCSLYAWFGKPHKVACGFQPWLLGLSVTSLIAALSAKTFRIWRIFRTPMSKGIITDLELGLLWFAIMLPALLILILWTIISTPTATMKEYDGTDHYVCETGGFTGPPGGIVFFFILVGYLAALMLIALFLAYKTRRVPSMFNEASLIWMSIFHLAFLGVVIIPVVMILNEFDPFISWIIRTIAILYAYTATLVLQFLPKVVGVIIIDRCKETSVEKRLFKDGHSGTPKSIQSTKSSTSDADDPAIRTA